MTSLILGYFAEELLKTAATAGESPHFSQQLAANESKQNNISPIAGTTAVAGGTLLSSLAGNKATRVAGKMTFRGIDNAVEDQARKAWETDAGASLFKEKINIEDERNRLYAKSSITPSDLDTIAKGRNREAEIADELVRLRRSTPEMAHLDKIRAEQAPDLVISRTGRDIVDNMGLNRYVKDERQLAAIGEGLTSRGPFYAGLLGKRQIYLPDDLGSPAVYAHELGHATGNRILNRGIMPILAAGARKGGFATSVLGSTVGTYRALNKKTDEEQDTGLKKARNIALLGGLGHVPLLAEEARASIRAVNMGRQIGKGTEYAKQLLPAFGTYAAKPLAITGGTALGVEALRRYRKKKNAKIDERK
jgi:hypothetical protein